MVTLRCENGYEFSKNKFSKRFILTLGTYDEIIMCNPIGCRLKDIPTDNSKSKIKLISQFCDPAILPGNCLPGKSFIEFECFPGTILDPQEGG